MITTPFYIEKRKSDGYWCLRNRHDVCVMEFVHEGAAQCHLDLCNETFQEGFAYCIDLMAAEARSLEEKRVQRAHQAAKSGVADLALAAGTDQPLAITGPGIDFQSSRPQPPEGVISNAIAKVKFVFECIKESDNA